jgi:hypothetical protein
MITKPFKDITRFNEHGCMTCKHWNAHSDESNLIEGWGLCALGEGEDETPTNPDTLAYAIVGVPCVAHLATAPAHGCRQWKRRDLQKWSDPEVQTHTWKATGLTSYADFESRSLRCRVCWVGVWVKDDEVDNGGELLLSCEGEQERKKKRGW